MTHVARSIFMRAPAAAIYALTQDVARWPELLPHYRWVRVLEEAERERLVEMAARRDFIPVRWTARQRLFPEQPRIEFEHVGGWTTGMRVAWTFEALPGGTRVSIAHAVNCVRVPIAREWFGRHVVADFFVQPIAGKTLARVKEIVETRG